MSLSGSVASFVVRPSSSREREELRDSRTCCVRVCVRVCVKLKSGLMHEVGIYVPEVECVMSEMCWLKFFYHWLVDHHLTS